MSPEPYLAPSLVRLRDEINRRWPNRDKKSDGWIGNASHAARKSEHNPDGKGCVHAIDVDSDGVDPNVILAAVKKHPAAWYIIWDRHIYSRTHGWEKRTYTGADPHTGHVHVSSLLTSAAENNATGWGIYVPQKPVPTVSADGPIYKGDDMKCFILIPAADPDKNDPVSLWLWTPFGTRRLMNPFDHKLAREAGAVERKCTETELRQIAGQNP